LSDASLSLFTHWSGFVRWLLPCTGKFPRSVRHTLTGRIDNLALDVLEAVIEAQYTAGAGKLAALKRAALGIDKLRILLRLGHDLGHLPHRSYEQASRLLDEAGRMTGGWVRQQQTARRIVCEA
jgi:hypothetical protein